jgi:hypothetical protein
MKDKNGKELQVGSQVMVPDPDPSDPWFHAFQGRVFKCLPDNFVIVKDQDDDVWTVEASRLEVVEG